MDFLTLVLIEVLTPNIGATLVLTLAAWGLFFRKREMSRCLKQHGYYDISLDSVMSACEELRDLKYINFRETTVAGPRRYCAYLS